MISRSLAVEAIRCDDRLLSRANASVQPKRSWRRIGLVALSLWLSLALLVFSIVSVARRQPFTLDVKLPPPYLPGSLLPEATSCDYLSDNHRLCSAELSSQDLYFLIDADTRLIRRTVMRIYDYTLGQLVVAWGTPTGMTQDGYTTYVHWGNRSVWLHTTSLRLDRQVSFILFDLEPPQVSPWRGFTRRNH